MFKDSYKRTKVNLTFYTELTSNEVAITLEDYSLAGIRSAIDSPSAIMSATITETSVTKLSRNPITFDQKKDAMDAIRLGRSRQV